MSIDPIVYPADPRAGWPPRAERALPGPPPGPPPAAALLEPRSSMLEEARPRARRARRRRTTRRWRRLHPCRSFIGVIRRQISINTQKQRTTAYPPLRHYDKVERDACTLRMPCRCPARSEPARHRHREMAGGGGERLAGGSGKRAPTRHGAARGPPAGRRESGRRSRSRRARRACRTAGRATR